MAGAIRVIAVRLLAVVKLNYVLGRLADAHRFTVQAASPQHATTPPASNTTKRRLIR